MTGLDGFLRYIPVGVERELRLALITSRSGPVPVGYQKNAAVCCLPVSAFTLAHTITLALYALGYVTVRIHHVEPIIAASIVYVAVEHL
jgi:hypothetical protein